MNKNVLKTGIQDFIKKYSDTDIMTVLLAKPLFEGVANKEIAQQIEAREKCKKKLPTWYKTPKIYYPPKLNIEQSSSEILARYKSELIKGKSLLDLTGGLGVDSYYFSQRFASVAHCEIDSELSQIATHNFTVLGAGTIKTHVVNGLSFLKQSPTKFDWIYIDPSRRDDVKGKIFKLGDCRPNIIEHLDSIFEKTRQVMLKSSPLLDISMGINELQNVMEIHIISVKNEVKELLWILKDGYDGEILVQTTNITNDVRQSFDFQIAAEKKAVSRYSAPQLYLYEPNASILKAGAFKILGERLGLKKLHVNTHLYTSDEIIVFPGRRFRINRVVPYGKRTLQNLELDKANITTRNFPINVRELRSTFKIRDGGDRYLFFCKGHNEKLLVLDCTKVVT